MSKLSKADDLIRRRNDALELGGKHLWERCLVSSLMDRLPVHLTLRDELIGDLRAQAELSDNAVMKAGMEEAVRRLIAL